MSYKSDCRVVTAARENSYFNHVGNEGMETGWYLEKVAERVGRVYVWPVS